MSTMTEDEKIAEEEKAVERSVASKLDKMAEAQGEAAAAFEEETAPPEKKKVLDRNGRQLRFEGIDIDAIETQFKGSVKLHNIGQLKPNEIVRYEGTAEVQEYRVKKKDGWRRVQVLTPMTLEIVDSPAIETPETE